MIKWLFILIITICSIYIACWLGVEMIAYNLNYKISHFHLFFIPLISFLACFFLGDQVSTLIIRPTAQIIRTRTNFKHSHHITLVPKRYFLIREYLLQGGKMSLCLWAMNESLRHTRGGAFAPFTLRDVFDYMEDRIMEQNRPNCLSKRIYQKTIETQDLFNYYYDFSPFFVPKTKKSVRVPRKTHEVSWNYASKYAR